MHIFCVQKFIILKLFTLIITTKTVLPFKWMWCCIKTSKGWKHCQFLLLFPKLNSIPWKTNKYFCFKKKSIMKTRNGCVFQVKWKDKSLRMFIDVPCLTVLHVGCDFHSLLGIAGKPSHLWLGCWLMSLSILRYHLKKGCGISKLRWFTRLQL